VPQLPREHALRRFLWSHIFNANGVNRKAAVALSCPGGLFARGWSWTGNGVTELFEHAKATNPLFDGMLTVPKRFELQGMGGMGLPLHQDGVDFYAVTHKYVSNFVTLHYHCDDDVRADAGLSSFSDTLTKHMIRSDLMPPIDSVSRLVDVLADHIFYVTGYHTHVGSVHHEATRSGIAPSAWYDSDEAVLDMGPPNAEMWKDLTLVRTANLRLPITGDPLSTEQRSGFKDKVEYQVPLNLYHSCCQDRCLR
jgi:hypothetical protein